MENAAILFTAYLVIANATMAMDAHYFTQVGAGQNRVINVSEKFLEEMKINLTRKVQQIQHDLKFDYTFNDIPKEDVDKFLDKKTKRNVSEKQ